MNNFSSIFYFYFLLENDCPVAIFVSVYVYVYLGMYMYVWYIRIFLLPRSPSSSAELSSGRPPFLLFWAIIASLLGMQTPKVRSVGG